MTRFYIHIFFLVIGLSTLGADAQSMSRSSELLNRVVNLGPRFYGSGVSFYDVNQDGLDDITVTRTHDEILCFISDGQEFHDVQLMNMQGEAKMPLWGDYDNDGDPDLFVTQYADSCKLFRNDGGMQFTDVTVEVGLGGASNLESFGASWGDYDNDGWLDLLISNYDAGTVNGNWLFKNNAGTFTNVSTAMGVGIGSDYSFQSSFIDVDFDGDLDVHIANDRFPIDAHLINEGDFFFNNAAGVGLDLYSNSMSSSFADYDHDGDFDFYVTNTTDLGNDLWRRNSDGTYTNVAQEENMEYFRYSWGALWIDIDNDSWEDLYVANQTQTGDLPPFFINQTGDFEHNNITNDDILVWGYAAGKGDFNGDGFYDIFVNGHNNYKCEFYKNNGSENFWLKLDLEGTASNRDAVGTLIEYWVNGEKNIRFTRSGDGFLTQDSQWLILGMGANPTMDSLTFHWPSGMVETYYDIPGNQTLFITEGATAELQLFDEAGNPFLTNQIIMCEGDEVTLVASEFDTYMWSNGNTEGSITLSQEGDYQLTAYNEFGVPYTSVVIHVAFVQEPQLMYNAISPSCVGDSNGAINWLNEPADWVNSWSDPAMPEWQVENLPAGLFSGILTHAEWGCTAYVEAWVFDPAPVQCALAATSPSCFEFSNGYIEVESSWGGAGEHVYTLWSGNIPFDPNENLIWENLFAGIYVVQVKDENLCSAYIQIQLNSPEPLSASASLNESNEVVFEVSGGTPPYTFVDASVGEPVLPPINAVPGIHQWWVTDAHNCEIQVEANVPAGIGELDLLQEFYCHQNQIFFIGQLPIECSIFNAEGQLVKSERIQSSQLSLSLAAGVYIGVCSYPSGEIAIKKLVVANE